MIRKIGLILALAMACLLSGLTPARAIPQHHGVHVTAERRAGETIMSVTIPSDGHLYQVGNVSMRSGVIYSTDTVCFFILKNPDVRGTGYGPVIYVSGNVDCRYIPASYGSGTPAPMWSMTLNVGLQQYSGPGLYANHWNPVRQGAHHEWHGWILRQAYADPMAGCFLAYEAWKFRQAADSAGLSGSGQTMWPQVDFTSGIYLPGCRSLLP